MNAVQTALLIGRLFVGVDGEIAPAIPETLLPEGTVSIVNFPKEPVPAPVETAPVEAAPVEAAPQSVPQQPVMMSPAWQSMWMAHGVPYPFAFLSPPLFIDQSRDSVRLGEQPYERVIVAQPIFY